MSELFSKTKTTTEPSLALCPSLNQNYGKYKTAEGVFQWLQSIWQYKVNPKSFGPEIFTPDCLLVDPFATVKGAIPGSIYFQLLFAIFPNLSGPHYSYAVNQNEFFVNWAFETTGGKADHTVAAVDIFCMKDGLVNYRLSTFDVPALIKALLSAYGETYPNFESNLGENLWRAHVDQEFAISALNEVKQRSVAPELSEPVYK